MNELETAAENLRPTRIPGRCATVTKGEKPRPVGGIEASQNPLVNQPGCDSGRLSYNTDQDTESHRYFFTGVDHLP